MALVGHSTRSGFTLMELVVALVIFGLIAMFVGRPLWERVTQARETTTETNLKIVQEAIDEYHGQTGHYPQSLEDLIRKPENLSHREWSGPYLRQKAVPKDGWNRPLQYHLVEGATPPYELYSWGPNGEQAEEDEYRFAKE